MVRAVTAGKGSLASTHAKQRGGRKTLLWPLVIVIYEHEPCYLRHYFWLVDIERTNSAFNFTISSRIDYMIFRYTVLFY